MGGQNDRGPQVHVDREIDRLVGELGQRRVVAHPGVGYQHVTCAGPLRHPEQIITVGQIGDQHLGPGLGRQIGQQCLPPGRNNQTGTPPGQLLAHGRTQPAAGTGYEDGGPVDLHHRNLRLTRGN